MIERRVERLGEESLRGAAARGGGRPRVRPRAAVSRRSRRRRAQLLGPARGRGRRLAAGRITDRVGRFRFAHALINQTLYEGLGATRRARMHQRVAEALEELYGADPASTWGARAALAAGRRLRREGQGCRLRAQSRTARLSELAPAEALKLLRRRGRADRRRRQRRALRGADRARRGSAPDRRWRPSARRCSRPRASPRSWATRPSRLGRRWQTAGVIRACSESATRNGLRLSLGRSSSMSLQTPPRRAQLSLSGDGAQLGAGPCATQGAR